MVIQSKAPHRYFCKANVCNAVRCAVRFFAFELCIDTRKHKSALESTNNVHTFHTYFKHILI